MQALRLPYVARGASIKSREKGNPSERKGDDVTHLGGGYGKAVRGPAAKGGGSADSKSA